jgi:predicted HAD superfamily Cof-like phosphohydrolase
MESRIMGLVKAMHAKFGLANTGKPWHLEPHEKAFRVKALQEELDEYNLANTLVDEYDALLDLIVFAVGTLDRQGLPLLEGFEKVMKANMAKEVGQNGEKRGGFKRDLVKPKGWVGPEAELKQIIDRVELVAPSSDGTIELAPSSDGTIEPGFAPKFDATKVRVDLLPIDAMTQVADVFGFGAKKYFANSYRQGETVAWSRTYGSILRHLFAFWKGEDTDPESGLQHLAHAGTQLFILMEHTTHNKDKDDRFIRGQQ